MIIYHLICEFQHEFEGWFNNSDDLVAQQAGQILSCPVCGSLLISKKITAPKLARKSTSSAASRVENLNAVGTTRATATNDSVAASTSGSAEAEAYSTRQDMLTKAHEFIDSNFEDVGNKFANEALSMHRGEKEAINIRGTASAEQIDELAQEGVTALPLPEKPVDKKKLN